MKIRGQVGGAVPRLNALIVEEEGLETAPETCLETPREAFKPGYLDPNTPIPHEPIEADQPVKPWKVLRTRNGNLPVYTRSEMDRALL